MGIKGGKKSLKDLKSPNIPLVLNGKMNLSKINHVKLARQRHKMFPIGSRKINTNFLSYG